MSQAVLSEEPDVVDFALDKNGRFLNISEKVEKFTGYTKEEAIGQNFRLFVHPQDQPAVCLHFQNIIDGMSLPPCEFRIVTRSGEQILVKVTASALQEDGIAVGVKGNLVKI